MSGIGKKIKRENKGASIKAASIGRYFKHYRQLGLDVVFPPQPLWVAPSLRAQGHERASLNLIDDPQCACCGFPFPYDLGDEALCGNCMARPPAYDRARAAFIYDAHSRQPILSFKHGGQTHGLSVFAHQLARAGRDLFDGADLLIPVPLHPKRLRSRRFNQAALLARALSRVTSIALDANSLQRVKATDSQGGKTAAGRRRNMQGAFKVRPQGERDVKDLNIILIDDVLTTGATIEACTRALKRAGAARVDVLTLARVVKELSPDEALADTFM